MSKERLKETFQAMNEKGKKSFVAYIMAGDGGLGSLKEKLLFLKSAGVTLVEIGIPFSDPVADGPVIQEAGKRALAEGTTLVNVLEELKKIKDEVDLPLVIMTYINPVFRYGVEAFARGCAEAGVSGVILPDVPYEEGGEVLPALNTYNIALIPLVTLTSPKERIERIVAEAEGFVYAVTVNGITGARNNFKSDLKEYLNQIKKISPVPVFAGFGISSKEQAEEIGGLCDGVIVG
ncbi:MAG TPA: tryptophan synthase subunit alpha, partial [Chondromyces sp.]|nr:tryptophan synthase subunit alpha [Chondromyces sp.]